MDTLKTEAAATRREMQYRSLVRPIIFGLVAALGLLTFYLGTITLAQG